MNILILGGSGFLGRHVVNAALAHGHRIAIFNRGVRSASPRDVELLRGDRASNDYASLSSRTWDAVIDTSATVAGWMRGAMAALKDRAGHYVFTSSVSAYRDGSFRDSGKEETAETEPWPATGDETDRSGTIYGAQKARCEQILLDALGDRATVIRPGIIAGPGDETDRFTYWPMRMARGGEVLCPGSPDAPMQVIDARDLAEWLVRIAEDRLNGVFNAVGPEMTTREFLEGCRDAVNVGATLTWVEEKFLFEHKVAPWTEMPLWIPQSSDMPGHFQISNRKAVAAGLTLRRLAETVNATMQWAKSRPGGYVWQRGILPSKEADVLRAWHGRSFSGD